MATKAQITANRANSQKSTGPRTAEGKRKVSQNARKHGLFASPKVIRGEDQGQFEKYRKDMLSEMRPVGTGESMLAERVVNLSWRLRRAEVMQDQALRMQIKTDMLYLLTRQIEWSYREINGLPQEESEPEDDYMTMGRAARNDIANYRVLDRLMLYERRIENSMYKTRKELGRLQAGRKAEQAAVEQERASGGKLEMMESRLRGNDVGQPAFGGRSEIRSSKSEIEVSEKRKPILDAGKCVSTYTSKDYDDESRPDSREDKANQSQFQKVARPADGESDSQARRGRKVMT